MKHKLKKITVLKKNQSQINGYFILEQILDDKFY